VPSLLENIPYYNFVKSVCRGPFPVAVYGVFIPRRDVLLHYVEM